LNGKTKFKMGLWAYDTFNIVFLDREGLYYKIDQAARRDRTY